MILSMSGALFSSLVGEVQWDSATESGLICTYLHCCAKARFRQHWRWSGSQKEDDISEQLLQDL